MTSGLANSLLTALTSACSSVFVKHWQRWAGGGRRGWSALPVLFPTLSSSLHTPARPHTSCPLFKGHLAPPRLQPGLGHRSWAPCAICPSRGRHIHLVASHSRTQVEVAGASLQFEGPGHWLPPPIRPLPSIRLATLADISSCPGSTKPATCNSSPWGCSSFPAPLREWSPQPPRCPPQLHCWTHLTWPLGSSHLSGP